MFTLAPWREEEKTPPPQKHLLYHYHPSAFPSPNLFCRYSLSTRRHVITVVLPVPKSHVVKAPVLIFIWANLRAVTAAITKGNDAFIYLRRREGRSERVAVGGAPCVFTGIRRSEKAGREERTASVNQTKIQAIFIVICAINKNKNRWSLCAAKFLLCFSFLKAKLPSELCLKFQNLILLWKKSIWKEIRTDIFWK